MMPNVIQEILKSCDVDSEKFEHCAAKQILKLLKFNVTSVTSPTIYQGVTFPYSVNQLSGLVYLEPCHTPSLAQFWILSIPSYKSLQGPGHLYLSD